MLHLQPGFFVERERGVFLNGNTDHTKRGIIFAATGASLWGLSGTSSQFLLGAYHVTSVWLISVRIFSAGVLMFLLALLLCREKVMGILRSKKDFFQAVMLGVAGLLFCQITYMTAIQHSNAGTASVLQSLNVVLLALYVALVTWTRPTKIEIFSVFLATGGVMMISTGGDLSTLMISEEALFWGIASAVAAVAYTVLAQSLVQKWGALPAVGVAMLSGGLFFLVFARPWTHMPQVDTMGVAVFSFLVIGGTITSFGLFLQGVGDIGPVKATLLGTLEPVSAAIAAYVLLGTEFTWAEFVGFLGIMTTVFLVTLQKKEFQEELIPDNGDDGEDDTGSRTDAPDRGRSRH